MINHSQLVDIARPFCKELLAAINETVNLCVVSGTEMLIIDKQVTTQTLRQDSIIGSSFSYSVSFRACVSAFSDENEVDKTLQLIDNKKSPSLNVNLVQRN